MIVWQVAQGCPVWRANDGRALAGDETKRRGRHGGAKNIERAHGNLGKPSPGLPMRLETGRAAVSVPQPRQRMRRGDIDPLRDLQAGRVGVDHKGRNADAEARDAQDYGRWRI